MAPRTDELTGAVTTWNDERGFGFISLPEGGRRIFVHVKDVAAGAARPQLGDTLTFTLATDPDGKIRAVDARNARQPTVRPVRRVFQPRFDITSIAILAAFSALYAAAQFINPLPLWVHVLYAGTSIVTFVAYALDKSAAITRGWRVPEQSLLLLGLVGGWPGAVLAQQTLRHKTLKAGFRYTFFTTVIANVLVFAALGTPVIERIVELVEVR